MQISDAEWFIMNLVWSRRTVDARTVVDQLAEKHGWSPATIKTMLHRLVKKGALQHEAEGIRYQYRAKIRRDECVRKESRSFLERVFGGDAAPALLHLVKSSKLSQEEIEELQALLDSKNLQAMNRKGSKE